MLQAFCKNQFFYEKAWLFYKAPNLCKSAFYKEPRLFVKKLNLQRACDR